MSNLDGRLLDEFTEGINAPSGLQDAFKLARVNADGTNLDYVAAASAVSGDGTLAAALAPYLRGTGMTVEGDKLRPRDRPRRIRECDHFLGGTTTSGSIGKLNWNLYSGTWSRGTNSGISQSTRNRLISAVAGSGSIGLGPSGSAGTGCLSAVQVDLAQALIIPNAGPLNYYFSFGLSDNANAQIHGVADAVGLYALSGTPNWQAIVRSANAGAPVDTGVLVSLGSLTLLTVQRSTSSWTLTVNNTSVTIPSLPTGNFNPSYYCSTATSGSTAELSPLYFGLESPIFTGAYSVDAFLEV